MFNTESFHKKWKCLKKHKITRIFKTSLELVNKQYKATSDFYSITIIVSNDMYTTQQV